MAFQVKWYISILVGAAITAAVAMAGWNLNETASIPKNYPTKVEVEKKINDFKGDHEKRHEAFEGMMKDSFNQMFQVQRDMQKSLDEINRKVH